MINQNSLGNNLTKKISSVLVTLILLFGNLPGFSNLTPKVEAMQIFIKLQIDPNLILYAEPTDRIEDVKAKIQFEIGISPDHQKLYFNNKELEDGNTLQDYSIQKDSIIQLFG
ncbi:MAG: ubiquitin-like protein, partial [Pseudolactococcus laudensis]